MRRLLLAAPIFGLGLAAGGIAHADTVQYDVSAPNPFQNGDFGTTLYYGNDAAERVQAGQITINARDTSSGVTSALQVYCVDIFDTLAHTTYNRGSLASAVNNGSTSNAIATLIADGNPLVSNATSSAALQIAVWDVLYDGYSAGQHDVTTGYFHVGGTDAGVVAAADADLANLSNGTWTMPANQVAYELLPSPNASQNLAYTAAAPAAPVPEPASLGLLFVGATGLAFMRRRRA